MDETEWKIFVYNIWNDTLTRYLIIVVIFTSSLLAILFSLISGLLLFTSYITGFFIFKAIFRTRPEAPDFIHALGFPHLKSYELSPSLSPNPAPCAVCGDGKCKRHRPSTHPLSSQPWLGLNVPPDVDKALEDFLNQALNQFIYSWYEDLSVNEDFVHELRSSVRYAICIFLRRLLKLNIPLLITGKFVPVALCHIEDYICSIREAERIQLYKQQQKCGMPTSRDNFTGSRQTEVSMTGKLGPLEEGALKLLQGSGRLHPATHSRERELEYLRQLTSNLLPHLLPPLQLDCKNWCALVRELLSGWVLLPALDVVADPNTINYLLLLAISACSSGTSQNSKIDGNIPPVSLLENFASSPNASGSTAVKSALLESLSSILKDQSLLYPFMQFLKKEGAVNILQFCLDVEEFNRKILNPDLDKHEIYNLYQEAWDLYSVYFRSDSPDRIIFAENVVEEMKEVLAGPAEDIVKLRTTTPLFQAYEHTYSMLENTLCPLFHQSEEYYTFLCGQRESAQFNKSGNSSPSLHGSPAKGRTSKKQSEGWGVSKLSSKIQKIRGALRSSPVEGQTVFYTDPGDVGGDVVDAGDMGEGDFVDEADDLDCDADFIEVEESSGRSLEPRDLSAWRITIPNVQMRREATGNSTAGAIGGNTRNPGTTFLIHVRRIDVPGEAASYFKVHHIPNFSGYRFQPDPFKVNNSGILHGQNRSTVAQQTYRDVPSECNWTVERKYSDFYLLESKLVEFHGEFPDNHLPPKRILFGPKGAEFMHSRRPKCSKESSVPVIKFHHKNLDISSKMQASSSSPSGFSLSSSLGSSFLTQSRTCNAFHSPYGSRHKSNNANAQHPVFGVMKSCFSTKKFLQRSPKNETLLRGVYSSQGKKKTFRRIFEEYLQKLLQMPNLKGSDLLHTFLRSPYDFACSNAGGYVGLGAPPIMVGGMVSELNLGRMIRRTVVPLRLRKERGQHLEPFLATFVNSTSATTPIAVATSACSSTPNSSHASPSISLSSQSGGQTLMPEIPVQRVKSSSSNVGGKFEWTDMSEEGRRVKGRCLTRSVFGNNFGLADELLETEIPVLSRKKTETFATMRSNPVASHPQLSLKSTFDCFLYLAVRVFGAGELVIRICLALGTLLRNTFNSFFLWLVDYLLRKGLSTAHIALLLRLLKGAVFSQKSPTVKTSGSKMEDMSKRYKEVGPALISQFQALPFWIRPFILRIVPGLSVIHSSLQSPPLNKQLAYSLLDVLAIELFPELSQQNGKV